MITAGKELSLDACSRVIVRPVPEDPELFFIGTFGPDLDPARAVSDVEYLTQYIRDVSKRPEIKINRVSTLADWRYDAQQAFWDHSIGTDRAMSRKAQRSYV